jgi:hypothetical protein
MKPLAIRASYSDLKLVKTRQVAQLIFEIPISDFDAAYDVLGGLPTPDSEKWFAIAALKEPTVAEARPEPKDKPARAKRDWRDMLPAQQAGIRCNDASFAAFLCETRPDDWQEAMDSVDECVRLICAVTSRSDLNSNHAARWPDHT